MATSPIEAHEQALPQEENFRANLDLFYKSTCADCAIRCGEYEWKVHQCILCPRNTYFDRAFNGNFEEAKTKVITWDGEKPFAVEGLLISLYTGRCPCTLIQCPKPESGFEVHLKLLQIADKLQVGALAGTAAEGLAAYLRRDASNGNHQSFADMVEAVRSLEIPIPAPVRKASVDMLFEGSEATWQRRIDTLWGEQSLERASVSVLFAKYQGRAKQVKEAEGAVVKAERELGRLSLHYSMNSSVLCQALVGVKSILQAEADDEE